MLKPEPREGKPKGNQDYMTNLTMYLKVQGTVAADPGTLPIFSSP